MKYIAVLLSATCLGLAMHPAKAFYFEQKYSHDLIIREDIGGRIGTYAEKYEQVRDSGKRVRIEGPCISACTLVLGIVPRSRICITKNALLGFHAAWIPGPDGRPMTSGTGTQVLWELYPPHIRRYLQKRGGLNSKMIWLRGKALASMYQQCRNVQ